MVPQHNQLEQTFALFTATFVSIFTESTVRQDRIVLQQGERAALVCDQPILKETGGRRPRPFGVT